MRGYKVMLDQAVRTRHCHVCEGEIKPGEYHYLFNSNSYYSGNVCHRCVTEMIVELSRLNCGVVDEK